MNLAWFGNNEIGIFDEFGMVSFWWIWHGFILMNLAWLGIQFLK